MRTVEPGSLQAEQQQCHALGPLVRLDNAVKQCRAAVRQKDLPEAATQALLAATVPFPVHTAFTQLALGEKQSARQKHCCDACDVVAKVKCCIPRVNMTKGLLPVLVLQNPPFEVGPVHVFVSEGHWAPVAEQSASHKSEVLC